MSAISKLFGIVSISISSIAFAGTWTPIAGIPEPAFGVTEEAPALPSPWDVETSGFYYVCESCPASGSFANGTPAAPRQSIPRNVSAGDVVVLAGTNDGLQITFNCNAAAPCFVLGDPANPPVASGSSEIEGSYYIIDGVHATLPPGISGGTIGLRGSFGAFRNGSVTGNNVGGGVGAGGSNILILNNQIMDNGDVNATFDQDKHGVSVGGNNVWIIGNEMTRNSGDGVQVGGLRTLGQVHHIYIGKNIAHGNKQTGFWVKAAEHVIISENISFNHVPSGSSGGDGMGGQYDCTNVWFLFNESHNNRIGISVRSTNDGVGTGLYLIGNYIHDIDSTGYDPTDPWSKAAVMSWSSADITIVNNTIDNITTGINLNGNTGPVYIYNNAITNMQHPNAKTLFAGDPDDVQIYDFNSEDGDLTIDTGTAPLIEKDPYAIFQSLYGMSISRDFEGNSRPHREWDSGAYEAQGPRPNPPGLQ